MSIINQVLLDLDKRRASGAERGELPDHVRALPEPRESPAKWLIAILGVVAALTVVAWAIMSGYASQLLTKPIDAVAEGRAAGGAEIAGTVVKPESMSDIKPHDNDAALSNAGDVMALFGKLSLELSSPPRVLPEIAQQQTEAPAETSAAIATSRVIGKPRSAVPEMAAPAVIATATAPEPVKPSASVQSPVKASAVTKQSARLAQAASSEIQKKPIKLTPQQLAEEEYGKATVLLNQGKPDEARLAFEAALLHYPAHLGARQGLFGMMMQAKKYDEAEQIMREGLQLIPAQTGFAMPLAHLQFDRGNMQAATDTLKKSLAYAQNNPDYLAFLAALLQRQKKHGEAIEQYSAALKLRPQSGVWLMGLGISLQAVNRNAEAQEAYRRAKASGNLAPALQAYVDQRLRQLQ